MHNQRSSREEALTVKGLGNGSGSDVLVVGWIDIVQWLCCWISIPEPWTKDPDAQVQISSLQLEFKGSS